MMTTYEVTIPTFTDESRVQFTATVASTLFEFICDFWDDLWHMRVTVNEVSRTCTLHSYGIYFPSDPTYQIQWLGIDNTILSGTTLLVAIGD